MAERRCLINQGTSGYSIFPTSMQDEEMRPNDRCIGRVSGVLSLGAALGEVTATIASDEAAEECRGSGRLGVTADRFGCGWVRPWAGETVVGGDGRGDGDRGRGREQAQLGPLVGSAVSDDARVWGGPGTETVTRTVTGTKDFVGLTDLGQG